MITPDQFRLAAKLIGCPVSRIVAVYNVETAGRGYLDDGRVKILFEGHRFWKRIAKEGKNPASLPAKYSNVVYKSWDKTKYKGGNAEWDRMSLAIEACKELGIEPECALDSASYGSFQILGENAELCGYSSAQEMLANYNNGGEFEQLMSFVRFVINRKIDQHLITGNFDKFAEGYNGSRYRENDYAGKMRREENIYLRIAA